MNLDHLLLDGHSIRFDPILDSQTLATSYIKLPSVQSTLNDVPAKPTLTQRRAAVGARVLGGIVFAIHVIHSELVAIGQLKTNGAVWAEVSNSAHDEGLPSIE